MTILTSFLLIRETAFIDESGELFPFSHETGSYVDPKTGLAHVVADGAEIGDSAIAVERFWQVLARCPLGNTSCSV